MFDATGSAAPDEPAHAGPSGGTVEVLDTPAEHRFEIHVDGALAGFTEYRQRPGAVRAFPHTEIEGAFQGRGLAQRLIREALDQTRTAHVAVLPYCPAVRGFIAKHPAYVDLVPPDRRAEFALG